jgi:hypothetical protein
VAGGEEAAPAADGKEANGKETDGKETAAVPATVPSSGANVRHVDSGVSDSESRGNLPDNQSGPGRASAPAEASKESTGGTTPAAGAPAAGASGQQATGTAPEAEDTK